MHKAYFKSSSPRNKFKNVLHCDQLRNYTELIESYRKDDRPEIQRKRRRSISPRNKEECKDYNRHGKHPNRDKRNKQSEDSEEEKTNITIAKILEED
mmetsp:Transcript_24454/g.28118  ORF Transcript_24454/g.28118 Transcript_24454/m.28118 type:complete len:97 (+) Transcript_24454:216-506(+)